MSGRPQFWTDDRIARLAALWAEGKTWREIADVLGCSVWGVKQARQRFVLPSRPNGRPVGFKPPKRPPVPVAPAPVAVRPGWPTKAQLMGSNARRVG